MNYAYPSQKLQDWLTQQWVIFRGKKIDPVDHKWLIGPFGNMDVIGEDYIKEFAAKNRLEVVRNSKAGLITDINQLISQKNSKINLSEQVIHFYENTSCYNLNLSVKWNMIFRFFGLLIIKLFSKRINQLNIPMNNLKGNEELNSEIITLVDRASRKIINTFWFRALKSSGQIIYSGVYDICTIPSGETCIKAVFPLPNGNATVLMTARVGKNSELILESSGKKFGDPGFYFLLKDSKGKYWSQFIRSFRDKLTVRPEGNYLLAEQILTLWHFRVLKFTYKIERVN